MRLSDSDEKTGDTDDSFDYHEAGMAEGVLEEVSSLCSEAVIVSLAIPAFLYCDGKKGSGILTVIFLSQPSPVLP